MTPAPGIPSAAPPVHRPAHLDRHGSLRLDLMALATCLQREGYTWESRELILAYAAEHGRITDLAGELLEPADRDRATDAIAAGRYFMTEYTDADWSARNADRVS